MTCRAACCTRIVAERNEGKGKPREGRWGDEPKEHACTVNAYLQTYVQDANDYFYAAAEVKQAVDCPKAYRRTYFTFAPGGWGIVDADNNYPEGGGEVAHFRGSRTREGISTCCPLFRPNGPKYCAETC